MLKCDLYFDYSDCAGTEIEFKSMSDKLVVAIGDGITNIEFALNDKQAQKMLYMLESEVYGENTLDEANEKVLSLESNLEDCEKTIEAYEELTFDLMHR